MCERPAGGRCAHDELALVDQVRSLDRSRLERAMGRSRSGDASSDRRRCSWDRGSPLTTADGVGVRRSALPRSLFFSVRQTLTSTSSTYQPSMPPQPSIPCRSGSGRRRRAVRRRQTRSTCDAPQLPACSLRVSGNLGEPGPGAVKNTSIERAPCDPVGSRVKPNADLQAHALRRCLADGLRRVPGHARWIGATGQSDAGRRLSQWADTAPAGPRLAHSMDGSRRKHLPATTS